MPAVRRTRTTELFWRFHGWLFRVSGGRLGSKLMGFPVLLLTTTGRKSGAPRTTPLLYMPLGDACVVIASNAGELVHPGWWLNLVADPTARIQRGSRTAPFVARGGRRGASPPLVGLGGEGPELRGVRPADFAADSRRRVGACVTARS